MTEAVAAAILVAAVTSPETATETAAETAVTEATVVTVVTAVAVTEVGTVEVVTAAVTEARRRNLDNRRVSPPASRSSAGDDIATRRLSAPASAFLPPAPTSGATAETNRRPEPLRWQAGKREP